MWKATSVTPFSAGSLLCDAMNHILRRGEEVFYRCGRFCGLSEVLQVYSRFECPSRRARNIQRAAFLRGSHMVWEMLRFIIRASLQFTLLRCISFINTSLLILKHCFKRKE